MKKILSLTLIILTLSGCGNAARTATTEPFTETVAVTTSNPITETSTATTTPVPTETPIPPLSLDVTKPYGEWDLSAFSSVQQTQIIQAMTDPDHTPVEVKNLVDQWLVEGIRNLTGDSSYAIDANPAVNSAFVGRYAEYLFTNDIHEVAPLPFAWRKDSLGSLDNFPVWNDKGRPGYLIEGSEWLGHDPNYGKPNALWSSVEWDSTRTGVGENISVFTPEAQAMHQLNRINLGHNQERDTIFGESFVIVYPFWAIARGDLMLLTQIAGVNPEVAQEAVIRMYGYDALPRYALIRIQYQEETIEEGDNSCMIIPNFTSQVCTPGTKLLPSTLFTLEHAPQRKNGVTSSRAKMLELMNMPGFTYPLRITLAGYPYDDGGDFQTNTFMDGALVGWDIKIPTVSPDFYK